MYVEINENKKWKRSTDGWIAGVCEGLGKSFDVNPNLIRVIWLIALFAFGTGALIYLMFALVLPREDELIDYHQDKVLGVCRRISEQTGIELAVVRLLAVFSVITSAGLTLLLYLLLHFLLPTPKDKITL
jgi:phage shock protein C